jgi:probable DNA metabolism protein
MTLEQVNFSPDFASWQKVARRAAHRGVMPDRIAWEEVTEKQPPLNLFPEHDHDGTGAPDRPLLVPKKFVELARVVAMHSDPQRWPMLYRLLWRLTHGEPNLLEVFVDPDVARAFGMEKSVRHDVHKMRAFVRFRKVEIFGEKWFVAWFEPEHRIVEHNAAFFVDRFTAMKWSILTPQVCAHWDGKELQFTAGVDRSHAPAHDDVEKLWLTYYKNIFTPARVKMHAMQAEMPKKYWKNLPETNAIPELLREAPAEADEMMKRSVNNRARDGVDRWEPAPAPDSSSLKVVRDASRTCTACPLYKHATQTVFGEGPKNAAMMLIGEQPGDQEDIAGKPFVGPAGDIMDRALVEAGINRREVYVTNAVKHFKWEPRGKRRIHQKPNSRDIAACRPWLEAELRIVRPKLVVAMGATAAQTLLGPSFRVTKERGRVVSFDVDSGSYRVVATVHPSSLLRQPDEESREREYKLFVADLKAAVKAAGAN